jgi:hypothetical protein
MISGMASFRQNLDEVVKRVSIPKRPKALIGIGSGAQLRLAPPLIG